MDTFGSVIQFLFVPESRLSIAFLLIFLACFIYGFFRLKKCFDALNRLKKKGVMQYALESAHINQKQYLQRELGTLAGLEVKIDDLPNLFVTIGVLGTFLGLGVAIHGAADLLNTDHVDLTQLNSVLSVIAFKFQTSVWGTFFSLLIQKFVLENYYTKKYEIVRDLEVGIYSDAVNTDSVAVKQLEQLKGLNTRQGELHQGIRAMNSTQNQLIQQTNDQIAREFKNLNAIQKELMSQASDEITALHAEESEETARQMDQLRSLWHQTKTSTEDGLNTVLNCLNEKIQNQSGYIANLFARQNELQEQLAQQQKMILNQSAETNRQTAQKLLTSIAQQIDKQGNDVLTLLSDQRQLSAEFSEQQRILIGDAQEASKAGAKALVQAIDNKLKEQTQQIENLLQEQRYANDQILDQQREMLDAANSGFEQSNQMLMSELIEQQNRVNNELSELSKSGVGTIMQELNDQVTAQREQFEQLIEQQNRVSGELSELSKSGVGTILQGLNDQVTAQREQFEKLSEQQNRVSGELSELSKSGVGTILQGLNDQVTAQHEQFEQLIEQQNRVSGELSELSKSGVGTIMQGLNDQVTAQREHFEKLIEQQNRANGELSELSKSGVGTIINGLNDQLASQRGHFEKLLEQQNLISKALVVDLQKKYDSGLDELFGQYKESTNNLINEQKFTKKTLEEHLATFSSNLDKSSLEHSGDIAELRRAIDILQKAIDDNSQILQDIILNFYDRQAEMDALRRSEVMNMANAFSTLLQQEGERKVPWRKDKEHEGTAEAAQALQRVAQRAQKAGSDKKSNG